MEKQAFIVDRKVGIIGLGIMGGAIAVNLIERGWQVFGIDLDAARRAEMTKAGVTVCESIAAVVAAAPVLLTSLPSPKAAMVVAREIAAAPEKGRIVVELSTLAVADKLAFYEILAPAGHIPLDCPLSGTGAQAKLRDLVVYASGDAATIAGLAPLFSDFAKKTASLGAYGNGSRMKFVANLLVAVHNVASAEAMVLGMKAGLDPKDIVEVIGPGAGGSRMFELRAPMMARDSYEPATMRVSTWAKDMAVIGEFARDLGVETPCFDATAPIYEQALAMGLGEADTASVCRVLEAKSGLKR